MKNSSYTFIIILIVALLATNCDLNNAPYEGKTGNTALGTVKGLQNATYGNYHKLVGNGYYNYCRALFQMGEYPADNVSLSVTTTDPLYNAYNYNHLKNMSNGRRLWRWSNQLIFSANKVIEHIKAGQSKKKDQLLGENLFLRAFMRFNLVNYFARPYIQGTDNPGIPLKDNTKINTKPSRQSVGEVYDAIVGDLKKAAGLMTIDKSPAFASKQVANAFLSRVFLFMHKYKMSIKYSNKVIDSGKYTLMSTAKYKGTKLHTNYFTYLPENNPETIFAVKTTKKNDHGYGNLGSMYLKGPNGVGWGQMFASKGYRNLLNKYPDDIRHTFIQPKYKKDGDGNIVKDKSGKSVVAKQNGYPIWYVNKFSYQNGTVSLSSPVILRLAEMYLNRAEAYAKTGKNQKAIEGVNRIRKRAGLNGSELYTLGNLKGLNSVLDVVLREERLEFAFEAHRKFDLLRNNRAMKRAYTGTHLNPTNPGVNMSDGTQIIKPENPRIIYFIPESEIEKDPNLTQNS